MPNIPLPPHLLLGGAKGGANGDGKASEANKRPSGSLQLSDNKRARVDHTNGNAPRISSELLDRSHS